MTLLCEARAFDCGCTTHCAKTINIGTFKTARTMANEQRREIMARYNNMARACCALILVASLMGMALIRAYAVDVRQAQIEQEMGR